VTRGEEGIVMVVRVGLLIALATRDFTLMYGALSASFNKLQ